MIPAISIPEHAIHPRAHSFSADERFGQFESVTGVRLWELSCIELSLSGEPSEADLKNLEESGFTPQAGGWD